MTKCSAKPDTCGIVDLLRSEVTAWLGENRSLLTNERDMQVKIAKFLEERRRFDNVFTEYRVPLSELKARGVPVEPNPRLAKERIISPVFPWNNQMSVDIVVEKEGVFAALELKYATRPIRGVESLFGEPLLTEAKILKNQAAANLTMYSYWKDVRRIEMLTRTYKNVAGGLALMISNSRDYWTAPSEEAKYANFSMHTGNVVGPGLMTWNGQPADSIAEDYPPFILDGTYPCGWMTTQIDFTATNGDPFKYLLSVIKN